MNTGQLVLGGLCILLGGVVVMQRSAASKDRQGAMEQIHKFSNDWHQAFFKLDEQGRSLFTVQTQLKVIQSDHEKATNDLLKLRPTLITLESNHVAMLESSQAVSNRQRLKILEMADEQADLAQRATNAHLAAAQAGVALTALSNQMRTVVSGSGLLSNQLSALTLRTRELESQLADPEWLRAWIARFDAARSAAASGPRAGDDGSPLELLPDGTVRRLASPASRPGSK